MCAVDLYRYFFIIYSRFIFSEYRFDEKTFYLIPFLWAVD